MQIKRVGVVGAGTMGNGCPRLRARGYAVTLCDVERRFLDRALDTIAKNLGREPRRERLPPSRRRSRPKGSPVLEPGKLRSAIHHRGSHRRRSKSRRRSRDLDRNCTAGGHPSFQYVVDSITKLAATNQAPGTLSSACIFFQSGAGMLRTSAWDVATATVRDSRPRTGLKKCMPMTSSGAWLCR